ncbi:hypothetical protein B0H13DRAFT_2662213 [Mycena leptocephala]|nr:hypothetical protein B0H13DRAFT_2662213 [Mycena leptocephala]
MPVSGRAFAASDIAVTASSPLLFVLKRKFANYKFASITNDFTISFTVIQYETDRNIEIEKDEAADEAEYYMHVDAEAADTEERSRSRWHYCTVQIILHFAVDLIQLSKENPGAAITKSIDTEERLPGCKDGLGVFPPGSDSVRTMLALELRERKRACASKRAGPPYLLDESLNYHEAEDPLSSICTRPARPQLGSIYQPPPQPYPPPTPSDTPTTLAAPSQSYHLPPSCCPRTPNPPCRGPPFTMKYWTLLRRVKDLPLVNYDADDVPAPHVLDFGSFARLGRTREEMRLQGVALPEGLEDADALLKGTVCDSAEAPMTAADGEYWISAHMLNAEGYTRDVDVVYEAVNGLANVRILGELVGTALLDVGERVEDEEESVTMDSAAPLGSKLSFRRTVLEFTTPTQYSAKSEDEKPVN